MKFNAPLILKLRSERIIQHGAFWVVVLLILAMIYGVGWIVATDTSIIRFLVMSVALLLTLGLGYIRFVQRGRISPIAAGAGVPSGEGIADIERRLSDLEERMEEAAQVFGRNRDSSSSS